MKKILTILVIAALFILIGCNEETCRPTASILTGSDMDSVNNPVVGRIGVNNDGVEAGLELNYTGGHVERQSYGAYILYEIEQEIIGTTPYLGFHALIAEDDVEERYGPILGTLIEITPRVSTIIEGQYVQQAAATDQYKAFAGIKVRF